MRRPLPYRFYKGLRFRMGAIFGGLFLTCLLVIGLFLYRNVTRQLEQSFANQLKGGATALLAKTETTPLIVPLPDSGDHFLLVYQNGSRTDTLFNNLPAALATVESSKDWRSTQQTRTTESVGVLRIVYAQRAAGINGAVAEVRQALFLYLPLALLASFIASYFLSGFLLRPVTAIINRAQGISLQGSVELLDLPSTEDELHQLTATLNNMLQRIRQQSAQQTAFFAAAAHELRTPLSNMLTELQVLEAGPLANDTKRLVQSQVAEVQRLKKLVNDFLLLSQLKTGTLPVVQTETDLLELCMEAVERFSARTASGGHRFKIEATPEEADFAVCADRHHVRAVLNNLLENALKYSQPLSVVGIRLVQSEDEVRISIQNSTETRVATENLTKEFVRQNASKEGFGLGLWLSDQLLSLNHGKLTLASSDDLFTATVLLPV